MTRNFVAVTKRNEGRNCEDRSFWFTTGDPVTPAGWRQFLIRVDRPAREDEVLKAGKHLAKTGCFQDGQEFLYSEL